MIQRERFFDAMDLVKSIHKADLLVSTGLLEEQLEDAANRASKLHGDLLRDLNRVKEAA